MDVSKAIVNRKSVRAYENRPVPIDVLKKIIEAGQWAPNAGPIQISVIQNSGLRQRINNRENMRWFTRIKNLLDNERPCRDMSRYMAHRF